jgi:sialidase-1
MVGNPISQVLRLDPAAGNPRNSEGDFVQLSDGRWLFVYTHFDAGDSDHAGAYLAGRLSDDDGATWSEEDIVVLDNEGDMNIMSVSLLRLIDGRIALIYLRKNSLVDCRPYLRFSVDEAQSWSEPIEIIPSHEVGYYVVNNDRVIQLPGGRLIVPTALHSHVTAEPLFSPYGRIFCYISDDAGEVWNRSAEVLVEAHENGERVLVQEPGVVALEDGRLLMFCRTDTGSQYVAYSSDEGKHWSPLRASEIQSPCSPASIKRIPSTGDLLLVWNNHAEISAELAGKRTPLTIALSQDDGEHWIQMKTLEDDPNSWYCYTAIAFAGDQVLLAHCAGDSRDNTGLNTLQITRVPIEWLYEAANPPRVAH